MQKYITVAIYIRVSTREQAEEGYSLNAQERLLIDFCKAKNYNLYRIYSDEGISAKDIKHRPGMLQLLADAREKKFDVILVSYSESFDSGTPAGRMVRSMLGTVAQFEREVISENVAMGLLERAKQGKRTCTQILGYDLIGDSMIINESEAEYVNFTHDSYLIYKSLEEVAGLARSRGYKGKRGRVPTSASILTILTRPQYAGYNVFKGKLYPGDYKPIRTVQQFNKVQRLILRQGKITGQPRKSSLYILPEKQN